MWVRLDDQFHCHEKVAELEPDLMLAAVGLHALALSWCGDRLTDGVLPKGQPARLAGRNVDDLIAELVRVGLWERTENGYRIHDYLDYNPSREEVNAISAIRSEAGKRGAESRWSRNADSNSDGTCHSNGYSKSHGQDHGTSDSTNDNNDDGNSYGICHDNSDDNSYGSCHGNSRSTSHGNCLANPMANRWHDPDPDPEPIKIKGGGGARARAHARESPEELVDLYHRLCPSLPRVRQLTDARRKRLRDLPTRLGDVSVEQFFARVEASDFLTGRTERGWRADIDWILKPEHVVRILEGTYDNRKGPPKASSVAKALELVERFSSAEVIDVSG